MQVVSVMRGTLTLNANGTVHTTIPTLSLQISMGSGWTISQTGLQTIRNITNNNRTVTWTGNFSLSGTFRQTVVGIPVAMGSENWGTFTATHRFGQ